MSEKDNIARVTQLYEACPRGDYRSRTHGTAAVSNWVFIWKLREGRVYSYEQFHDAELAALFR